MPRTTIWLLLAALAIPSGCRADDPVRTADTRSASRSSDLASGVRNVMKAKLIHAQGVLEAITVEDFAQAEHHAATLAWLSRQATWRVHTTVAYGAFSEEFHDLARALEQSAQRRDIDALSREYVALTASCMECHAYLRREGLVKDLPGAVSMGPARMPIAPDDPV